MFTAKQIGTNILKKAIFHLGEAEIKDNDGNGTNWSDRIKIYLAYVWITFAAAWCAAFASWCIGMALQEMGLTPKHVFRSSSSHEAVNFGRQHGTTQTAQTSVSGDLLIERGGDGELAGDGHPYHHTTILDYVEADGTCHWIAGNTHDTVARGTCRIEDCFILRPYVLPV